jgi:hypothetical protein
MMTLSMISTAENRWNRYHLVTVKTARGFAAFCGTAAWMVVANVFRSLCCGLNHLVLDLF